MWPTVHDNPKFSLLLDEGDLEAKMDKAHSMHLAAQIYIHCIDRASSINEKNGDNQVPKPQQQK
jgi:hypothetical protein